MLRRLAVPMLRTGCRCASGAFNYKESGKDWHKICQIGKHQSPIDFPHESEMQQENHNIRMKYSVLTNVALINKKTTLSMSANLGSLSLVINGQKLEYQGEEFHFHAPSEHTFTGKYHDLEMHMVHSLVSGPVEYKYSKAVVGILFDTSKDQENPFISSLNIPTLAPAERVDLPSLVKRAVGKTYCYDGSLTTPPCSEIVHWIVLPEPQPMSKKQLQMMKEQWEQHLGSKE